MWKSLLIGSAILGLNACASVPQQLAGQFQEIKPADAANANGARVRWGGQIVETVSGPSGTCIYALARPLDHSARPRVASSGIGGFVACRQDVDDLAALEQGREITVTGTLNGAVMATIGDVDYTYPRIAADSLYLWPERLVAGNAPFEGARIYDPSNQPVKQPPVTVIQTPPPQSDSK